MADGGAGLALLISGIVLAAAGTGVGTYSAIEQGKAQKKAAKYNQEVAENNASAAQQQAAFEAERVRRRNIKVLGAQRAAAAKSGLVLSGSISDVISESSQQGEIDRLAVKYTGAIASDRSKAQAGLFGMQASNATRQANLAAAGTLLSGLGSTTSRAAPVFGDT